MGKKYRMIPLLGILCFSLSGCSAASVWSSVLVILSIFLLALAIWGTWCYIEYLQKLRRRPNRYKKRPLSPVTLVLYGISLLLFVIAGLVSCQKQPAASPVETTPVTTEPTEPPVLFQPEAAIGNTAAAQGIRWEIFESGEFVSQYLRETPIRFSASEDYFALPGICTFRGNNYRDTTSYGTVQLTEKALSVAWETETSRLNGTSWSGSGWTGQPLLVQWDDQTRSIMGMYEEKKVKENLTEVIYATLDGHIYFLDLDDGSYTRDPINVGFCFKGSGSLDPRGYPLLYVGAGDVNAQGKRPRMFIISLIDNRILYEYGDSDPLSQRYDNDKWCAFDSAPIIHKESDTLIWPGENGLLYTFRLNTQYNAEAGTISIAPEVPVVTRYATPSSGVAEYWYGYEASAVIVENYLYISENGGMFYCVDLNTMALVWAQNTKDDSNASPVFEPKGEDGGYLYTAPSLHWTKDHKNSGSVSIYKLDAITGDILWEAPFAVFTQDGVSGGVQSTPLLGKAGTNLAGTLFCSVSRTPNMGTGTLVALDTETGAEKWRYVTDFFAWSSPVAVYTDSGEGYVILGDSGGKLHFLDGSTGELLHILTLNGNIEATPAVFENTLVIGTRKEKIYGITIK